MATATPSAFQDTAARALRAPETPNADWDSGMNNGANSSGIGISGGPTNLVGEPQQFTLLDQTGSVRFPQLSQVIGGRGYVANADYPSSGGIEGGATSEFIVLSSNPDQAAKDADSSLDGTITVLGAANLQTLAAGWTI